MVDGDFGDDGLGQRGDGFGSSGSSDDVVHWQRRAGFSCCGSGGDVVPFIVDGVLVRDSWRSMLLSNRERAHLVGDLVDDGELTRSVWFLVAGGVLAPGKSCTMLLTSLSCVLREKPPPCVLPRSWRNVEVEAVSSFLDLLSMITMCFSMANEATELAEGRKPFMLDKSPRASSSMQISSPILLPKSRASSLDSK
jgi:hypothetical protein